MATTVAQHARGRFKAKCNLNYENVKFKLFWDLPSDKEYGTVGTSPNIEKLSPQIIFFLEEIVRKKGKEKQGLEGQ